MTGDFARDGYMVFDAEVAVRRWSQAAYYKAQDIISGPIVRRHGETWFVGVDALRNAPDGSVDGVPLDGIWRDHVDVPQHWHHAQLSVVYPGYPKRDPGESEAAHLYRVNRDAAHVDGLLPEGPDRCRHLREPHGFVLGLPLTDVRASPLVVWPGSHLVMRAAFAAAFVGIDPSERGEADVTDAYQRARRDVFERCDRIELPAGQGQAILLDRHLLHGVAPWGDAPAGAPRMVAYFRPLIEVVDWL